MVRSLHRACSRCKAEASSGLTTRKEISTPLGRVSVWSLFMPIVSYPWCLYCLGRGVLVTSGAGASRKFARTRNGAGRWRGRGPGLIRSGPLRFPLRGLRLRVLGPYLAVDLLDEGLAILILLLVPTDLLELLERKAVKLLHDVVYSQVLVVRGLQGTEDSGLELRLPGGLLSPPQDLLGLLGGLLGYPEPLLGYLLGSLQSLPGYLLEGPHAPLHLGERQEEVPVSPHPLLRESPIRILLLAYEPREGLGGAHVLLCLLAQNLRGIAHPALHELGVALLELEESHPVCKELLGRPGVLLLEPHELEPAFGDPNAAALCGGEVLDYGLEGVALGIGHLVGGARRLVDVSGGSHCSTSIVVNSNCLLLCSYHTYVQCKPRGFMFFVLAPFTLARGR